MKEAKNVIVYYHVYAEPGFPNDIIHMQTVSKEYWDREHDTGPDDSSLQDQIALAMLSCGTDDMCYDADYSLDDDVTVESVIEKMHELGFDLITNPELDEFLADGDF